MSLPVLVALGIIGGVAIGYGIAHIQLLLKEEAPPSRVSFVKGRRHG